MPHDNEYTDDDFENARFDFSDYDQPFLRNRQRIAQVALLMLWIILMAVLLS